MENQVLYRIFKIFGLVHSEFDPNSSRYIKNLHLQLYSIFLTISIQTFNGISYYYRWQYMIGGVLTSTSILEKMVLIVDCALWIILNFFVMFQLIFSSFSFCKFLNGFLSTSFLMDEPTEFRHKLYPIVVILAIPLTNFLNFKFTNIAYFTIISHYFLFFPFVIGYMYEWTWFDKLNKRFGILQRVLQVEINEALVKINLESIDKYFALSKRATKLFMLNKLVGVGAVLFLLSFYWFYSFEYDIVGSIKKKVYVKL